MRAIFLTCVLGVAAAASSNAAAQTANCYAAPPGPARNNCLYQQQQIYQQQQQFYEQQAREQYQMHQDVGRALQYYGQTRPYYSPDGTIARYGAKAWNAPRYYYQHRYGAPQ